MVCLGGKSFVLELILFLKGIGRCAVKQSGSHKFVSFGVFSAMSTKRRFRKANAFAQSDQTLHSAYFGQSTMQSVFKRTKKTQIRLHGCAG